MKSLPAKTIVLLLALGGMTFLAACGSGGSDAPFVFGGSETDGGSTGEPSGNENPPPACAADTDCGAGKFCSGGACLTKTCTQDATLCSTTQKCQSGTCVCDPVKGSCGGAETCTQNPSLCTAIQKCENSICVCDPEKGSCGGGAETCTQNPSLCTATQKCENSVCVCDPAKTTCGASAQACEVNFDATIALKIDDDTDEGHYDSPSTCAQYSGAGGFAGPLQPGSIDTFLVPPSQNTDLYCCSSDDGSLHQDPYGNEIFCDTENRHNGEKELAATRWKAPPGKKMRLKFDISADGSQCHVVMVRDEFPDFHLENTAIDASLVINAGKDYQQAPYGVDANGDVAYPTGPLNEAEIVGDCVVTTDAGGNINVEVTQLPLRFFVTLYKSNAKCELIDESPTCADPFTIKFNGETDGSYQIIPGFGSSPLSLTTGSRSQQPKKPNHQIPFNVTGNKLHFDEASGKTVMSLVTALEMPASDTSRDDNLGTGQLLAQLGDAILSAEISGKVTKLDGSSIKTLADLRENCNGGGVIEEPKVLELDGDTSMDGVQSDLMVTGTTPDQPYSAEVCMPGQSVNGACQFAETSLLPYAKDVAAGDPLAGVEAKFIKEGTMTLQNKSSSTESVTLQVADHAGAFKITNSANLTNITMAPGNSTTLNIRFEPETNANGCVTNGNFVDCQASLTLSSSHSISLSLKGRARLPKAELVVEELATTTPFAPSATVVPSSGSPVIDYGEATVGIQTKTKLLRISNTGVRDVDVTGVQVQDAQFNFRMGSLYQGNDFEHRQWKVGMNPWKISPAGSGKVFFFVNYGPFGKVTDQSSAQTCGQESSQPTRCDGSTLLLSTAQIGNVAVSLKGKATKDTRAVLEVYFKDEKKFESTGINENPPGFGPDHLYLAKKPLQEGQVFSFRQDMTTRDVYVRNGNGSNNQLDSLHLTALPASSAPDKFVFTPTAALPVVIAPGTIQKVGEVSLPAVGGGDYQKLYADLQFQAESRPPVEGASGRPPVVGGYLNADGTVDKTQAASSVTIKMGRAVNAPNDTKDLRINRLFAGFDAPLVANAKRMVSSTTRGIASRGGLTGDPLTQFTDIYTAQDALIFDAEKGEVTFNPIVTTIDPTSPTSEVEGIRLFNGPGSKPVLQYNFQCQSTPGSDCGFFYLYIGGLESTSRLCNGKPPIKANPGDNNLPVALNPAVPAEMACLKDPANGLAPAKGFYDPLTGEISFKDMVIRLFSPNTPSTSGDNKNLDSTLRTGLTTECLTNEFIPDSAARPDRLVPDVTLNEALQFVTDSGFPNPLTEYVGDQCSDPHEMHGRRMGVPDVTNTLDDLGSLSAGAFTFDLASVGKIKSGSFVTASPFTQAEKMMYTVIKAEAGNFP